MPKLLGSLIFTFLISLSTFAQVPYENRIQNIREIAQSTGNGNIGSLAGLMVQTQWQLDSHRDQIPAWNFINSYLTIKSHHFLQLYLQDLPCQENEMHCLSWMAFFAKRDQNLHSPHNVSIYLWRAHMDSIYTALRDNPDIFNSVDQIEERNFLRGWIRFVQILADVNFPSTYFISQVSSKKLLPKCSPLGASHCQLKRLPRLQKVFVKKIIWIGKRPMHMRLTNKMIQNMIGAPM